MLLRRHRTSVRKALEHLVGMQAQVPDAPYVGLWARLMRFRAGDLSALVADRQVVRASAMRGTIHLLTDDDFLALRPVLQAVLERDVHTNTTYGKERLEGLDVPAVLSFGKTLLEQRPRTAAELRDLLGRHWPDRDPAALAYAVRGLLPLVHVPPRGLWRRRGPVAMTMADTWLGRPVPVDRAPDSVVLRYLAAYGPATAADAGTWSGLRGMTEVFDRLRPRLTTYRDERGRELFDLPEAPLPDPQAPAPPRFLPEFDNVLLSHADRTRIVAEEHRTLLTADRMMRAVLLDGFARATWRLEHEARRASLVVTPFESLAEKDRGALEVEGRRLLRFWVGPSNGHVLEVRFSRS